MLVFGWKMKCFVKYDYLDCYSGRTRRVEASYEEIATVASLPTNDMICHLPFEPRIFGVGLLAMTF